jgi:hypothetical protein
LCPIEPAVSCTSLEKQMEKMYVKEFMKILTIKMGDLTNVLTLEL